MRDMTGFINSGTGDGCHDGSDSKGGCSQGTHDCIDNETQGG